MRKKSLWGTVSFLTAAHATIVESFQPSSTHSKVAAAWYAGQHAGAGFLFLMFPGRNIPTLPIHLRQSYCSLLDVTD